MTAGLLVLRWVSVAELKAYAHRAIALIQKEGPLPFFSALAILPAVGIPAMAFTLTAGPVFGPEFGMPAVVAMVLAACTVNMLLSYWLARYALRPWLTRLVAWLGYPMPRVPPGDLTALIVLLRVTPGIPFFAQNYLLGVADAPFWKYLIVSCLVSWPHTSAWVIFGRALGQGRSGLILLAVLALIAVTSAAVLVRRHYGAKAAAS